MEDNICKLYGLKKVINASGKMTILGGSRISTEILETMNSGGANFFLIKDLLDKVSEFISGILHVEDVYIVSSASAGIAQCVASSIAKDSLYDVININNQKNTVREIIIPKAHNIDYGAPVEIAIKTGGGKLVEAGYANICKIEHVEALINENTAALIYIKSHHCVQKGILSIEDYINLGKEYSVPVIVDAAAEEDLTKYYNLGADAVIYSGTKAIEGPTSGIVIGRKYFIKRLKLQSNGIGRVMKIGKENILGITKAIELYTKKEKSSIDSQIAKLEDFNNKLNAIDGIEAICSMDSAGRDIVRSEITFNEEVLMKNAIEISNELKTGEIRIYTRDYRANEGKIEIDIRDVSMEELDVIYKKINKIIGR
ncbi:MAG: DgaE family pyridoxal phosphate-dependent ammonia lyase [Clostridium chrysemydis]|uniref:DgaE family pyridoxal phosphate-dependent ammonia lyase n=1 Tax=Clostridium chrysemydis TaxID=2665504 RepID=UPI003F36F9B5